MDHGKNTNAERGKASENGVGPSTRDLERINKLVDFSLRHELNGEIDNWWDYWALDEFNSGQSQLT